MARDKRKDKKGYLLRTGECQRADGRYSYAYTDRFISRKYDIKPTTRSNYNFSYDHYVREGFGKQKIGKIHYSDVKKFYYDLLQERKLSPVTVDKVNTVLHSTFKMAVRDEIVRSNPTEGIMAEIKKSDLWYKTRKSALTLPEQRELLDYMDDNHQFKGWVPIITVLLGTAFNPSVFRSPAQAYVLHEVL